MGVRPVREEHREGNRNFGFRLLLQSKMEGETESKRRRMEAGEDWGAQFVCLTLPENDDEHEAQVTVDLPATFD